METEVVVVVLDRLVRSGELQRRERGTIQHSVHMVRHPRGSYIGPPLLCLGESK